MTVQCKFSTNHKTVDQLNWHGFLWLVEMVVDGCKFPLYCRTHLRSCECIDVFGLNCYVCFCRFILLCVTGNSLKSVSKDVALSVDCKLYYSDWRHRMVDGAEFWISCKQPAFLSRFSHLQVIQNSAPSTTAWRQCDIRIEENVYGLAHK